jgi:hypothetical protein
LGCHGSDEASARAYGERAAPIGWPVIFPVEEGRKNALKERAPEYEGIHRNRGEQVWTAVGVKHAERLPLGCFKAEEAAARAVDGHLFDLGLPRKHFPEEDELRKAPLENSSDFLWVAKHPKCKKWKALIGIDGKQAYLGAFGGEKQAARAFDERAVALGRPVNFLKERQDQAIKTGPFKYRGLTKQGTKWIVSSSIDGDRMNLGGL